MYFNYLDGEPPKNEGVGKLERLESSVQQMLQESEDRAFSEYLCQMRNRIISQQYQIDLLASELDSRYHMYQANMQAARRRQAASMPQEQQTVPQSASMQQAQQGMPQEQQTVPQSASMQQEQQTVPQSAPMPQAQYVAQQPQSVVYQAAPRPARQKSNMEFTVGAAVLSIVGGVFILIALVLLGINFMNGFVKGMSLYALCLAVMLISELLLYRRWPKLGTTFSAISVGGFYLSTLINYLALKNFNMWIAIALTLLITAVVIFLSKKKDAASYRILGMAAVYICMLLMPIGQRGISQAEFLVVTAILFLINIVCLLVPIKRAHMAIDIVHMALNTLFAFMACFLWETDQGWGSVAEIWHYPAFVFVSLVIMQMIFVAQVRRQVRQKTNVTLADNAGICVTYGISAVFYALMIAGATDFVYLIEGASEDIYLLQRLVCSLAVLAVCAIPMLALRGRQEKWFAWYLANLLIFVIHFNAKSTAETTYCLAVLLLVSKALSFAKKPMPRICDAVLTAFAAIPVLADHSESYVVPLFAVMVLSVLCINYWETYFEIVLSFVIALFTSMHMLPMLKLPVFVGILFAGMLLFNNVKRWRGKGIVLYNGFALAGQAVCYFLLINPVYHNAYLTYLCMLIFGVSTIIICFHENYRMDFKGKRMVLAIFLTYMALIIRTNYSIVNSILMMLIALICVGIGFAERRKEVRIYGLVLSLLVCGKIVLYDFLEAPLLQKTVVFFIVGVLALAISAIYMILEKKQNRLQKQTEMEKPASETPEIEKMEIEKSALEAPETEQPEIETPAHKVPEIEKPQEEEGAI